MRRDGKVTAPLQATTHPTLCFFDSRHRELYDEGGCCCFLPYDGDGDIVAEYIEPEAVPAPPTKTLRDEFAMAAMDAIIRGLTRIPSVFPSCYGVLAYEVADAMLAARKEQA